MNDSLSRQFPAKTVSGNTTVNIQNVFPTQQAPPAKPAPTPLPGPPGPSGAAGVPTVFIPATENIAALSVVTGTGYMADSTNIQHLGKVVGLTLAAVVTGQNAIVQLDGQVTYAGWSWTAGDAIWLNAKVLSATPPGDNNFFQRIGTAISATSIVLRIGDPRFDLVG